MLRTLRQIILIAAVALVTNLALAKPVWAADKVSVGGYTLTKESIVSAINAPTPNLANTTAYVFYTLSVIINGTFDGCLANGGDSCQTTSLGSEQTDASTVQQAVNRNGLLGGVGFLMGQLISHPPASAQTYMADLVQHSRLTSPVYAQGVGFGALNPILGTWKAFRDIAYYLLTVMFFITGFLILMRSKISGNVAVTVQNALPRLVITLIMITFSYAIAGLIVDIMYVVLYLLVNLFNQYIFQPNAVFFPTLNGSSEVTPRVLAFDTHVFSFFLRYVFNTDSSSSAWGAAQSLGKLVSGSLSAALGGALADAGTAKDLLSGLLSVIFVVVFGIALLISMFRVFFELLMSYAGFVINVVLSPLLLLQNAFPGKGNFMDWIKNLVGGLAPFVVAIFMIFMSLALTGSQTRAGIGYQNGTMGDQTGLRLPLILTQEVDPSSLIGVLGMGFMLMLPEVVKITKKLVGAKEGPFDQFKDAALKNFKQGWTGNKYMPGAKTILPGAAAGGAAGLAAGGAAGYAAGGKLGTGVGRVFGNEAAGRNIGRVLGTFAGGAALSPVLGALGGYTGGAVAGGADMYGKYGKPAYEKLQQLNKDSKPIMAKARNWQAILANVILGKNRGIPNSPNSQTGSGGGQSGPDSSAI